MSQPTWFRRCVRLWSCDSFVESNIVAVGPQSCPPSCDTPSIAIQIVPPSYYDANDGTAILTLWGNQPTYTISWPDGSTATVHEILAAGQWALNITDANGCTFVHDLLVEAPDSLQVQVTTTASPCGQNDGDLDAWAIQVAHNPISTNGVLAPAKVT